MRLGRWPDVERARHDLWGGHLAAARATFERLQQMTADSGIEFQRPYRLGDLAAVELAAGHLVVAAQLVDDGIESATDAGNPSVVMWLRYPEGLVAAHLGDDERAIAAPRRWTVGHRARGTAADADGAPCRGVLALASGDAPGGARRAPRGRRAGRRAGQPTQASSRCSPTPSRRRRTPGQSSWPRELAAELEAQAAALELPWVDAAARRGRGLAALAAGDPDAADHLAAAAAAFDALGYALDAARAWWWHGRALHWPAAAERPPTHSTDARIGSCRWAPHPWAALVRGRPRADRPGRATGALTETKPASPSSSPTAPQPGVAAALFVSVATVEAHLTRIYRKLGVRSRTELSRRLTDQSRRRRSSSWAASPKWRGSRS